MTTERVIARVGTAGDGRVLEVCCQPYHVGLRDSGVSSHNGFTMTTDQARQLGGALVRAADSVEGVER